MTSTWGRFLAAWFAGCLVLLSGCAVFATLDYLADRDGAARDRRGVELDPPYVLVSDWAGLCAYAPSPGEAPVKLPGGEPVGGVYARATGQPCPGTLDHYGPGLLRTRTPPVE